MSSASKAVIVALAGVVGGLAIFFLVVSIAGSTDTKIGEDRFEVGDAENFADLIESDRQPLQFADALGGDRPIFVQHLGDEPDDGWLAFDAAVDGCPLRWDPSQEVFEDTCTGDVYPRDGAGLPHYRVVVSDGDVIVDLRAGAGDD